MPFASVKPVKWTNNDVEFYVENTIWNNIGRRQALIDAVDHWNMITDMDISLYQDIGTSNSYPNGYNEIYYGALSGTNIGLARTWWGAPNLSTGKCYFSEADIIFDLPITQWETAPEWGDLQGALNFSLVAIHEIGHTLGQAHDNTRMSTMNSAYPSSGHIGANYQTRPYGSDSELLRTVYPSNSMVDVAASMWTIIPPPGQNFAGCAFTIDLIRDDYSTLTNGSVSRGENVFFRYSISNLGNTTKDLEVKFYMSNDTTIGDAGDIYLGMAYYTLPGSTDLTGEKYITIPTSRTGFQHFGYAITPASGEAVANRVNNKVKLYRTYWVQ